MFSIIFYIFENFHRTLSPCWASSNSPNIISGISCCIYIGRYINISSPINSFYFSSFGKIPNLKLILHRVATCQYFSILKIKWLSWNIGPIKMFDTFGLSDIPYMNNWIPTSWNNSMVVNKFDRKNSVVMANMIPISLFANFWNRFGLFIIYSDIGIFSSCCKLRATSREVDCIYGIILLSHSKKLLETRNMPVFKTTLWICSGKGFHICVDHWPPFQSRNRILA